ncbi:MAG: hypothetical protein FD123_395 [Bacteroidetes bacterium]|nr:MAG: hypothetical protein FD123_395 [Bacteroidota bacterium]
MKRFLTVLVFLFCCALMTFSQERKLSLSGGSGFHQFSMASLNKRYFDEFAVPAKLFPKGVSSGIGITGSMMYSFDSTWSLGFSYAYLAGKREGTPEFITWEVINNQTVQRTYYGKSFFTVSSHVVSIQPQVSVSSLCGFGKSTKPFIQRLGINGIVEAGYGFGKTRIDVYTPSDTAFALVVIANTAEMKGQGISIAPSLQIEYPIISKTIYFGIQSGYRYHTISELKDVYGEVWEIGASGTQKQASLEFNGVFANAYLRFRL